MTTDREFIIWIAIACVVISSASSSSVIEGNNNGVCKRRISYIEPRTIVRGTNTYREQVPCTNPSGCFVVKNQKIIDTTYVQKWKLEETCCENYKDNDGTCEPQCSSPCMNGYCAQPNTCACNPGWEGDFCNEPRLCIVDLRSIEAVANVISRVPFGEKTEIVTDNPPDELMKIKKCLPECRGRIDSANLTIRQSADTKYYLIPEHSACNMISADRKFWKMHVIGGVVVGIIILLLIVLGAVYVVRRKRKTTIPTNDKPTKSIHNGVNSWLYYDDVVPQVPDYDDVIAPPNGVYDEVYVKSISDYDEVNVKPIQQSCGSPSNPRMVGPAGITPWLRKS